MSRLALIGLALVLVLAVVLAAALRTPAGPRSLASFDPDRMADLETDMWQAYYLRQNVRLFRGLVTMLHEQYRYSWAMATRAAFYLARAASTFADAHDGYERVLPDLERAYTIAKSWTGASFDAGAVARAELAWWVARRIPGKDSAEQVGALIAEENALLFGVAPSTVLAASTDRARAGRLRDDTAKNPDWRAVSDLLHQSYRELHGTVN